MDIKFQITVVDPMHAMWPLMYGALAERGLSLVCPATQKVSRLADEIRDEPTLGFESVGSEIETTDEWLLQEYIAGRSVSVMFWNADGDNQFFVKWTCSKGRSGPVYVFYCDVNTGSLLERFKFAGFMLEVLGRYQDAEGLNFQCIFKLEIE